MPEPDRHESQPAPEDTGPAVDPRAVRDRAEVVAATVHGRGITRDDGCPACVLARRDVPALLDLLADVEDALDEAMPHRAHHREPAFYVRHLAAQLAATRAFREGR